MISIEEKSKETMLRESLDQLEELFSVYSEIPVEEAIARSGLDPVDVGYQRIQRLKTEFDKRMGGRVWHGCHGAQVSCGLDRWAAPGSMALLYEKEDPG